MSWNRGLQRLRLVGTVALVLGLLACASVLLTRSLGYAPDTIVEPLFTALFPAGMALILVGALLWVAIWVLRGFLPPPAAPGPVPRADQ